MKIMRSDEAYTGICTIASALWAATLVTEIGARTRIDDSSAGAGFACIAVGFFVGSVLGLIIARRMFRSWPLLGLAVGVLVGYLIPTVNIEVRQRFMEARAHILNVIHFAVGGASAGLIIDILIKPPQWNERWQFSLSTLLWFVTVFAIACSAICMYLQILSVQR